MTFRPADISSHIAAAMLTAAAMLSFSASIIAETPDEFRRRMEKEYEDFAAQKKDEFASFRERVNSEYASFMERPWKAVEPTAPLKRPVEPTPEPPVINDNDDKNRPLPVAPRTIDSERVRPAVDPQPRPQPIAPIDEHPTTPAPTPEKIVFFGTSVSYPRISLPKFRLSGINPKDIAGGWRKLTDANLDPLLKALLDARRKLRLSDWHFFRLVDRICATITTKDSNEHTLLTGYLLSQAGYDLRFAADRDSSRLLFLFSTSGVIYGRSRYFSADQWYYPYGVEPKSITLCDINMPGSTPMSLAVEQTPALDYLPAERRTVNVHGHAGLTLTVTPNRNLIELMADYPEAGLGKDVMSRWTAYAQTPASPQIVNDIYPKLREAVNGMNQYQAVGLLLKVAQSFPYGYDDKIWGRDRVFFMDESWNYPYSDCEDHAINFTRMVRDILGLETALLHYPGHIAAAVVITDGSQCGDYLTARGDTRRYTVCDPTYFYASPGATAPAYRSQSPTLIPLR